jgi:hypothetical protein
VAWFGPFGMEIKGDVTLGVWLVVVYPNSARNALWLFSSFLGDRVGRPVGGGLGKFGFGIGSFFEVRKRGQVPVLTDEQGNRARILLIIGRPCLIVLLFYPRCCGQFLLVFFLQSFAVSLVASFFPMCHLTFTVAVMCRVALTACIQWTSGCFGCATCRTTGKGGCCFSFFFV